MAPEERSAPLGAGGTSRQAYPALVPVDQPRTSPPETSSAPDAYRERKVFEWSTLPRWPNAQRRTAQEHAEALVADWRQTVGGRSLQSIDLREVDRMLARHLEILPLAVEVDPWLRKRLAQYNKARKPFREAYRSADVKGLPDVWSIRADLAVFSVWRLFAEESEALTTQGAIWLGYLYTLRARVELSSKKQQVCYEKAASAFFAAAEVPENKTDELKRRGHIATSHALRARGFGLLRGGTDRTLRTVADLQARAAEHAELANLRRPYQRDSHASYMAFWAHAIRVRVGEMSLDIKHAREALDQAIGRLDDFPHANVLFDRPGLWSSSADLRREVFLIDAIEHLLEDADVEAAAGWLRSWLAQSESDELIGPLKRARVQLRLRVLEALALVIKGHNGRAKLGEAQALMVAHPQLANVGQKLIDLIQRSRARPLDETLRQVAKLIPLDTVVDSPTPAVKDALRWMPTWFRRFLAKSSPPASCARLLTVWYLRVITDYLFSVYVDELLLYTPYRGPVPECPDLSLASVEELARAIEGLYVAMGWGGQSGRAIDDLLLFCRAAQDADDDEMLLAHLLATMQTTERHLYPTPLFVEAGAT
jgi:hypothetical protein